LVYILLREFMIMNERLEGMIFGKKSFFGKKKL